MIPRKIFQSWKTKELKGSMRTVTEKIKEMNPEYEYYLYDDKDCRDVLLNNFGVNYANAFDALIPGAFKCDLWRYAMLYLEGGIYIDIDMELLVPFRDIIEENDEFVSVADRSIGGMGCGMYQAFIACVPKHPIMLYSLQLSFSNIATRRYDMFETLSITGPIVAGIALNLYWKKENPYEAFKAGRYGSVKLLVNTGEYVKDLDGKKIIRDKFDGYNQGDLSYTNNRHYHTDPRQARREKIIKVVLIVIGIAILGLLLSAYLKIRWKKCEMSLSSCEKSDRE